MARKPRIHYPGAFYHVILRGNAGNLIFFTDQDRYRFFFLLQEGIEKYAHRIHAYCLMNNHIHLIIQVGQIPLSRIMQNVSFRYTRYINKRKKQWGHLFQGRYKALLIDVDNYLLELVRYIHNNPVRAGIVVTPEKYTWSSHNVYIGETTVPWLTTQSVLIQFHNKKKQAIGLFIDFVLKKKNEGHREEFHHGTIDGRILGEENFGDSVFTHLPKEKVCKVTIDQIIQVVCEQFGIQQKELYSSGRHRKITEPRSVAAVIVRETEHLRLTDLSIKLNRDLSGLSQAASRLDKRLVSDKNLRKRVNHIMRLIR